MQQWYLRQFRTPALRYGFALTMAAAAIGLRYLLAPILGPTYIIVTLVPFIFVVALFAGIGPTILNAFLAGTLSAYLFSPPLSYSDIYAVSVLVLSAVLTGWLVARVHDLLEQMRVANERFRKVLEIETVGVLFFDTRGNFLNANDTFLRMIGHSRQALEAGRLNSSIVTLPQWMERTKQAFQEILETGRLSPYEKELVRPDGSRWWGLFAGTGIGENEAVEFVIDITGRKNGEENLRQSETKFRAVFEQAAIGIGRVRFDDARWIDVNDAFCEMLGYSQQGMLSTPWPQITHPEDIDLDLIPFSKMAQGQLDSYSVEKRFIHKQGHFVWARLTLSLVRDSDGNPDYEVAIIEDITERKNAEQQLKRNQEQLLHLKNQIERSNEELRSIISVVSHDLKSPLTSVQGFGTMIKSTCDKGSEKIQELDFPGEEKQVFSSAIEENKEYVDYIITSAENMNRIIESMVQVGRVGLAVIKPEKLDMNGILAEIKMSMEYNIKAAGAEVTIDNLPGCYADRTQTTQIFMNLLNNAVKYLHPDRPGKIKVYGYNDNYDSVYCVEDNGLGIPEDKQQYIFELFTRIQEKGASGEGIGLAMVKRMADRNNGTVWVESQPGKGSRFFVKLPGNE